jgi:maltooligosyltrehalose trehalohydrolase
VPDPQDPATFERSKLTREADDAIASLYRRLLAMRRELPAGADADAIDFDEKARWLRVRRGEFLLVCNFAREQARVPAGDALRVELATHEARLDGGAVVLGAQSGALLR